MDIDTFREYRAIGRMLKPQNRDLAHITEWPYGTVKELQMRMQDIPVDELPGIFTFVDSRIQEKDVWSWKWHDVYRFYRHLQEELKDIEELEKLLYYEPTSKEENAGIHKFNEFGPLITIDRLADGDVLKYDAIEQKPYHLIFAKLKLEYTRRIYNENLERQNRKGR
jgi:hypothetical protein